MVSPAGRRRPELVLVLGHGAGGDVTARDLAALASALPPQGVTVIRVRQPWRVAGRKVAAPPPVLDRAWTAVVEQLRGALPMTGATRFVLGGRSAGARVACRTAVPLDAAGCLALAFPLHPPGRPGSSRVAELTGAGVPTLVVQGTKDAFGGPEEFPPGVALVAVPGADHGLKVAARGELTQAAALDLVVASVASWLEGLR